eukprot:Pgem_evm1s8325
MLVRAFVKSYPTFTNVNETVTPESVFEHKFISWPHNRQRASRTSKEGCNA